MPRCCKNSPRKNLDCLIIEGYVYEIVGLGHVWELWGGGCWNMFGRFFCGGVLGGVFASVGNDVR